MKAAAVPLVLVPALGAVQGGFQPDAWVWSGALAAWAAAVAPVASGEPGLVRTGWRWLAAVTGVLVWTALSASWSARPAQSILEARRAVLYAAVVLALLLLARRGSTRLLVLATYTGSAGLALYALFRYLLSARHRDPFELHTLNQPLGYANALGILAALAILLAIGIASTERGAVSVTAAATVPPLVLALTLTSSNGSWLALGAGLAASAVLLPRPQRFLAALAVTAVPAAALAGVGRYSRFGADVPTARLGGAALVGAALGGTLVAAVAALASRGVRDEHAPRLRRTVVAVVVVLALGAAAAVGRAASTEPRATYWRVAWHDYTAHPLLGSGAGTFAHAWARSGHVAARGGALDAHSLYLETLAELGPVGLLLVLAFVVAPLRRVVRDRRAPYVAAAAGAYVAFVIHAGLDWDWEMPAVVVAGLGCGAGLLAARPARAAALPRVPRAVVVTAALVLAGCAIAGARSHTVPSADAASGRASAAGPPTLPARHRGALAQTVVVRAGRYLP